MVRQDAMMELVEIHHYTHVLLVIHALLLVELYLFVAHQEYVHLKAHVQMNSQVVQNQPHTSVLMVLVYFHLTNAISLFSPPVVVHLVSLNVQMVNVEIQMFWHVMKLMVVVHQYHIVVH